MRLPLPVIVMIAGGLLMLMQQRQSPSPAPPTPAPAPPTPAPGPDVPSAELQQLVAPIVAIDFQRQHSREIAAFYRAFADVLVRDEEIIGTTADIREANQKASALMFQQTGIAGGYPSFSKAATDVLDQALTNEQRKLDAEIRSAAVDAFNAIAWAVEQ